MPIDPDPATFARWFTSELDADYDAEGHLPMVLEAHAWLQSAEASAVRDVITGLLSNPPLWDRTIAELAASAFEDFTIDREMKDLAGDDDA